MRSKRKVKNIYVFYRISDNGFKNKIKPEYITKKNCLKNALSVFKGDNVFFKIYIDNVIEETDKMIHSLCDERGNTDIIYINCKSGGFSFRKVFEAACELNDDDLIYFLEDDYLHLSESLTVLKDAAEWNYTDYITLYDHPDKYDNNETGVNPYSKDFGEITKVFKTNGHHWKITNSTTMTFAAFVDVLKRDKEIFWKWTETGYPFDFEIFVELINQGKFLSSPIQSLSTHGETKFLAPFVEWEKETKKGNCCISFITHKDKLTGNEEMAFKRMLEVFSGKYNIKIVIPNNINTEYYEKYAKIINLIKLDNKWFKSISTYNHLLCTKEFYDLFSDYQYVLIYQSDCWVYQDRLEYFMSLGYDYYGAPWPLEPVTWSRNSVGNGGLSLRKVSVMKEVCQNNEFNFDKGEDLWFCILHKNELNICDLDTACNFSIEILNDEFKKRIKTIPMGLHGKSMMKLWDKFDFWLC